MPCVRVSGFHESSRAEGCPHSNRENLSAQEFQLIGDNVAENVALETLLLDHCAGYTAPSLRQNDRFFDTARTYYTGRVRRRAEGVLRDEFIL